MTAGGCDGRAGEREKEKEGGGERERERERERETGIKDKIPFKSNHPPCPPFKISTTSQNSTTSWGPRLLYMTLWRTFIFKP
jgi:hypothetical protein